MQYLLSDLKFKIFTNNFLVQVPTSVCSEECKMGYKKTQLGIRKCCFSCTICPRGTYINSTGKLFLNDSRKRVKVVLSLVMEAKVMLFKDYCFHID